MMSESCSDTVFVSLKPFSHQVAGKSCIFEITPAVVCKPRKGVKMDFYQALPSVLKPYVPICHGLTEVRCHRSDNGLLFYAEIPRQMLSMPIMKGVKLFTLDRRLDVKSDVVEPDRDDSKDNVKVGLDTWCNRQIQVHLGKYGYWSNPGTSHSFIMLGNVLESYKLPCVIDIKLGTSQYCGKNDIPKRQKLEALCSVTTSLQCGLRICGLQVYKLDMREYVKKDKYYGKTLDVPGLHRELRNFFNDGFRLRTTVIKSLLLKLNNIYEVVVQQDLRYLFSCSMLLIYDGAEECNMERSCCQLCSYDNNDRSKESQCCESVNNASTDVRIVDFAHAFPDGNHPDLEYTSGFLLGFKNIIDISLSLNRKNKQTAVIGIPLVANCASLLADPFLYFYKAECIQKLLSNTRKGLAPKFNFTFSYINDVFSINNNEISNCHMSSQS